ncbi:MAG: hypothetical protein K0U37_00150 [Gammaproteobacteria bacterium]|nr:hypothetical protein [Gammaproteobacteria bacterium]
MKKKTIKPLTYNQLSSACQSISLNICTYFDEKERLNYVASLNGKALHKYKASKRKFFRTSSTPIENICESVEKLALEEDVWRNIRDELDKLSEHINSKTSPWEKVDLEQNTSLATLTSKFAIILHRFLIKDEDTSLAGLCTILEGENSPLGISNPQCKSVIVNAIRMSITENSFVVALTDSFSTNSSRNITA